MMTTTTSPAVDALLAKAGKWQAEVAALRDIALASGLTENVKWGQACYTLDGANIVLIHTFKEYCALLFFKGALMPDPQGMLVQQTANVQAARQLRFTSRQQIAAAAASVAAYIDNAIAIERAGLAVARKPTTEFAVPSEFQAQLDASAALKGAFAALTPGRQRAYLLHFGAAKQAATRAARVDKATPRILAGKGLDD
jgi:uncharacterized protein YdeI (YjbR/CyaY-like superfamily)